MTVQYVGSGVPSATQSSWTSISGRYIFSFIGLCTILGGNRTEHNTTTYRESVHRNLDALRQQYW